MGIALILGFFAALGVVLFLLWYFSADQRARRAIASVPIRAIPDVIGGERVRVVGTVELVGSVAAPLSARPCAYWRVVVEEQRGAKNKRWVKIVDEHEGVDFMISNGEHRALVKTDLCQPVLDNDASYSSGFMNDATPELEAFLAERGYASQGWVFNKSMRYREGVVEAGETVAVVGVGRWEADPERAPTAGGGYRDAKQPERLVLEAPDDGPLLLSDEPSLTKL